MPPTLYSVAIFVTDIERAKTFYRDHLGLSLVKEGSFGAEFCEGRHVWEFIRRCIPMPGQWWAVTPA